MNYIKIIIIQILLIPALFIQAQDFQEDMIALQNSFSETEDFQIVFSVASYKNKLDESPNSINKAVAKKQQNNYFYKMGHLTTVINDRCLLIINEQTKSMIYTPFKDGKKSKKMETIDLDIMPSNVAQKVGQGYEFLGIKNNLKHYKIVAKGSLKNQTEFFLNSTNNQLEKAVYQFDSNISYGTEKVVIDYQSMETNPVFTTNDFSELRFVSITPNGTVQPVENYKNYHFVINK